MIQYSEISSVVPMHCLFHVCFLKNDGNLPALHCFKKTIPWTLCLKIVVSMSLFHYFKHEQVKESGNDQ